jgi:hypothetical protein
VDVRRHAELYSRATTESFGTDSVAADMTTMQALLDQSLRSWLEQLKANASG